MFSLLDQVGRLMDNPWLLLLVMFSFAFSNLFFPPIPLETATLLAGYLSGTGRGSLVIIIIATSSGMFLASLVLYLLTRKYGLAFLSKTPLQHFITEKFFQRTTDWFQKYGLWAVFLGKLVPGMSLYSVLCCGLYKIKAQLAVPALFLSNLIFFTLLALIGKILGHQWREALPWLRKINLVSLLAVVLVCAGFIFFYKFRLKKGK